jgi:hypothetical protein
MFWNTCSLSRRWARLTLTLVFTWDSSILQSNSRYAARRGVSIMLGGGECHCSPMRSLAARQSLPHVTLVSAEGAGLVFMEQRPQRIDSASRRRDSAAPSPYPECPETAVPLAGSKDGVIRIRFMALRHAIRIGSSSSGLKCSFETPTRGTSNGVPTVPAQPRNMPAASWALNQYLARRPSDLTFSSRPVCSTFPSHLRFYPVVVHSF